MFDTQDLIDTPFPAIDPPPALPAIQEPAALVPATIKDTVLAQFAQAEAALTTLAAKYTGVAFDVTTNKGLADAKAARLDLRENGRFMVQRAEKRVKDEVNDLKKVMGEEVARLVAIVRPTEDAIHIQIEAEEDRREAEKAEKARIEAERTARFNAQLDVIRGYAKAAAGLPSEKIAKGIDALEAMTFGPEWEEFAQQATETRQITLDVLRTMHGAAVERESEAAERQRQREENARVAAELAEQRKQLEAQQAEILRQAKAIEDERAAEATRRAEAAKAEREAQRPAILPAELDPANAMAQQLCSIAPQPEVVAFTHRVDPTPVQAMPEAPAPLFIELGDIEAALGFRLEAGFIVNVLKVEPKAHDAGAPLFNPSQWPDILAALTNHINTIKDIY